MTDHGAVLETAQRVSKTRVRTTSFGNCVLELETEDGQTQAFYLSHQRAQTLAAQFMPPSGITCPNCGGSGVGKNGYTCIRCGGSGQG